jgi:probable HAF family extracellular repeat protein
MRHLTIHTLAACALLAALTLSACDLTAPEQTLDGELSASSRAPGAGFTYATFDVPNSTFTRAFGINANGDIVGSYVENGVTHGFLLRDGVYTTLEYPGAAATIARGIGPDGTVVGNYRLPGGSTFDAYGFKWTAAGGFEPISIDGHLYVIAQRILPDGTIIGCVHDDEVPWLNMKGFTMSRRGVQVDDIFYSMHNGGTPDGRTIVGLHWDQQVNQERGYIIRNGVFSNLHVPGSNLTQAWDINPAGEVVGLFRPEGQAGIRGFVLRGDQYVTVHVPGSFHTHIIGINARGVGVGSVTIDGRTSGLVATPTRRP